MNNLTEEEINNLPEEEQERYYRERYLEYQRRIDEQINGPYRRNYECRNFQELIPISGTEHCDICAEDINVSEATTLACRHRFHSECINQWVNYSDRRRNCP